MDENGKKTVMIVDDSRLARMVLTKMLQDNFPDWSITEAVGGEDALEKFESEAPQAAIVDVNMPDIEGPELAEKLLAIKPGFPITLLTANIQKAVRDRAESLGIGYLSKPPDKDGLQEFLSKSGGSNGNSL